MSYEYDEFMLTNIARSDEVAKKYTQTEIIKSAREGKEYMLANGMLDYLYIPFYPSDEIGEKCKYDMYVGSPGYVYIFDDDSELDDDTERKFVLGDFSENEAIEKFAKFKNITKESAKSRMKVMTECELFNVIVKDKKTWPLLFGIVFPQNWYDLKIGTHYYDQKSDSVKCHNYESNIAFKIEVS